MRYKTGAADRSAVPAAQAEHPDVAGGADVLRRLLSLPPDVAARIRREVPRRRSRHPQLGPSATFGDESVP